MSFLDIVALTVTIATILAMFAGLVALCVFAFGWIGTGLAVAFILVVWAFMRAEEVIDRMK